MEVFDSFFEIEQSLYKTRLVSNISLKDISSKDEGLHIVVMYRIEKHKNYHMSSLLKYVKIMNKKLYADNILIDNLDQLGELLKSKRTAAGLSLLKTYASTGIMPKNISRIENGEDYNKNTLIKYLSIFPIILKIK